MQSNKEYALDWLIRRGITKATLSDFSIHWGSHISIGECIVIPINTPDGHFSFNKYRRDPVSNEKPKYLYDQGGKVTLFGADHLSSSHQLVVVTEGELDSLVLWSRNIPAVSSTGGALSFQKEWVDILINKDIYLCFDNDDTGAEGMVKTLLLFPEEKRKDIKIVFVPEQPDIKDISDFVARGGDFEALMSTAISYPTLTHVTDDLNKRKASWLPTRFHKKLLEALTPRKPSTNSSSSYKAKSDDAIERAKAYPIPQLLSFSRTNAALCPFHKEKTPSLHYYPQSNSTYCFGACGRHYDSIDIYRKLNNASFTEAIDALSSLK